MSVKKKTTTYGVLAVMIAAGVILGSALIVPGSSISTTKSQSNSSTTSQGTSLTTSTLQSSSPTGGPIGTSPFIIQLTDPPIVPIGARWLNLTYTNVELNFTHGTQSRWAETNATGTVNLMELVNVSSTIAVANIPSGSIVNQIRFDIGSVQINVNGTVFNVTTVNSKLLVPIVGGAKVQNLTAALLDLTPKVVEITTGGTGAPIFLLVPSATAIVRQSVEVTSQQTQTGSIANVTSTDRNELQTARGNVSVVSSSLSVSGNATAFSITIKNAGNVSVALEAVSVHGQFSAASAASSSTTTCQASTSTTNSTTETGGSDASPALSQDSNATTTHTDTGDSNGTSTATTTATQSKSETSQSENSTSCGEHEQPEIEQPNQVVFVVNGASLVPVSNGDGVNNGSALVLKPGQTITLSFSGVLTLSRGDSGNINTTTIVPVNGSVYSVQAEFSNDAEAVVQVNAT